MQSAMKTGTGRMQTLLRACCVLWIIFATQTMGADKAPWPKEAEPATMAANAEVLQELPFWNTEDFDDAQRGFIATLPKGTIYGDEGKVVWDLEAYSFLSTPEAPPTVNPSLWRQAQLNMNNGLFEITTDVIRDRGIYQVRGFDLASMMIVEGDNGVILIDPMSSVETARAALDLYRQYRGNRPVKAVIYTHTHADHFGGVRGVVTEDDLNNGVKIMAPDGFLEHAVSENVFAGAAMNRRSSYHLGFYLQRGPRGQVDAGLGKANSLGQISLVAPQPENVITKPETAPVEIREVDGVEMHFLLAPDTEAPAEMLIWFPQFSALCAAEDMNHLNHNLLTLRGAQVRSARNWWKVINQTLDLYASEAEVMFFAHTWPVWGQDKIVTFMKKQRDLYKYVHDQSLHLLNQGYTMVEVAEMIQLPESLAQEWFNRDYYGTVNHNAKAVYQRYLGWYDSNPANLHPLPPEESARKFLEYMGSASAVMAKARQAFKKGEYRWVAQIMNLVVFAEPDNRAAKELQADALEQLGYQAESASWRNNYLTGASELRNGVPEAGQVSGSSDSLREMTLDLLFDYWGVLLNGPKADGRTIVLNWNFTDTGEQYILTLENSALTYSGPDRQSSEADTTLSLARTTLDEINLGHLTLQDAVAQGLVQITGNPAKLVELLGLLERFDVGFNIVTP